MSTHGNLVRYGHGYCCARVPVKVRGSKETSRACKLPALHVVSERHYCGRHVPITEQPAQPKRREYHHVRDRDTAPGEFR